MRAQMCRFVELTGELMTHATSYITRVIESAVREQDYKGTVGTVVAVLTLCADELTRRHVIDERVTHAIEGLTGSDGFFARYVPLVAECVVSRKCGIDLRDANAAQPMHRCVVLHCSHWVE